MAFTNPTVDDFKDRFRRDFPFGDSLEQVQDADITIAMEDTTLTLNTELCSTQAVYTKFFLYLSAHHLVVNLRNSSQGIAGQYSWLQQSKGVGSVNEAFAIPQRILDNPELAMLAKTNYGAQYLQWILPLLTGQMFIVCGRTQA